VVKPVRGFEVYLVKLLGVLPEARARKVAGILEEMFAYGD